MKNIFQYKNSLFWRISITFLWVFILVGLAYVFITVYSTKQYYEETTQRLNANVAEHMLLEVKPFVDGKVNEEALPQIMHSMMAVNPSLEVYLLDTEGKILKYVVLDKKVRLSYVSIEPVKEFLETKGEQIVLGDDPKNPGKKKVFSATAVEEEGILLGYVYMILVSEEYENIANTLWNSYLLKMGVQLFGITLLTALLIGLGIIWLLTKNLRIIIQTVNQFEQGDLKARIPVTSNGELSQLSRTFNHMASTILDNIEELKEVDTLRRDLIANVSHDLRTPISIIHGYVETMILKEGTLNKEEEKKYLEVILKSTSRLKKLVADLFELSKLEARQIQPQKEPFHLAEILHLATEKYSLIAEQRGVKIHNQITENASPVYADVAMIERVIQNLLDNAIKHADENGAVTIELKENGNAVIVDIINDGEGIPEKDIPLIFDRYYKAENDNGVRESTGLGLAIVKNIMEIHNSSIRVKSKLKEYTSFSFDLPLYQGV